MTLRTEAIALVGVWLLAGCLGGESMTDLAKNTPKTVSVTSGAFSQGGRIPAQHTCDGPDVSPALSFGSLPSGTTHVALIMDDPDAPRGTWLHWTFWNLPSNVTSLPEGANMGKMGAREGKTDSADAGYSGPCPPPGTHRYFFKLYALKAPLDLAAGASLNELTKALTGKVLAWGELMGTYARG